MYHFSAPRLFTAGNSTTRSRRLLAHRVWLEIEIRRRAGPIQLQSHEQGVAGPVVLADVSEMARKSVVTMQ